MLLFIPIRTDSPVRRIPRVNHALIAISVVVYLLTNVAGAAFGWSKSSIDPYLIWPTDLRLYQFFTYQFLHGDFWHLIFNMFFLWIFGNAVNSKMGHVTYFFFYLACGVFAGVGHAAGSENPCLGASGAVAGITTAYMVLFPRSTVTVFYWIWFFIGTLHIRALWVIGIKLVLVDNIVLPNLSSGGAGSTTAYSAHIAGYVFGFIVSFGLLLIRALPRDQYDILALMKRYYQRQQFKAAMADPEARARANFGRVARPVSVGSGAPNGEPAAEPPDEISKTRARIAELLVGRDYSAAAELYQTLVSEDPSQCLPRSQMLMVANQLTAMDLYPQAAAAYERFLKVYPTGGDVVQVKLVLGIIYAKYLQQYDAAQPHLRECAPRLANPEQIRQANHWLEAAAAALRGGPSTA